MKKKGVGMEICFVVVFLGERGILGRWDRRCLVQLVVVRGLW